MITVQLIKKVLSELDKEDSVEAVDNLSLKYEKITIEPINNSLINKVKEKIDDDAGVSAMKYAEFVPIARIEDFETKAMSQCAEYAIIGFWRLNDGDALRCYRSFDAPNPQKRVIRNSDQTELSQVLYVSQQTKEVFLFYRDYSTRPDASL